LISRIKRRSSLTNNRINVADSTIKNISDDHYIRPDCLLYIYAANR
jgi:hypothetical protein